MRYLPRMMVFVFFFALVIDSPVIMAQTYYRGPAFGSISGGVAVSTHQFPDSITTGDRRIIRPRRIPQTRVTFLPLAEDRFDRSRPGAPAGSNEFYDPAASPGILQSRHKPAVTIDFQGPRDEGWWYPPDPHLAAGPAHVLVVDNKRFIIYDKQGNRLKEIRADDWFANLITNSGAFDCQVFYDHFAGRWVQEWLTYNLNDSTSHWLVSVSDDDNPIGTWWIFAFPNHLNGTTPTGTWGDYPKIGYDHQALYISARQLSFTNFFHYSKLCIIPKSQLYANTGGAVNYTDIWSFRSPSDSTRVLDGPPVPAVHLDSSNIAYLIVDSPFNTGNFITLFSIENPLSQNPVITGTNIPVTAALRPPNATQSGGPPAIFTDGRRYRNAVVKDGSLWTANSVAGGSFNYYAFAHYLRLDVVNRTVLEDVAFGANGYFYYYPAITVDRDLNVTMVFTRSTAGEYASAGYTGRRETDPPGLAPSTILRAGKAKYDGMDAMQRNRWGDYMGIALDPASPNTVWGFIQYAETPLSSDKSWGWGTQLAAFTQEFTLRGTVRDALSALPVGYSRIGVLETNHRLVTDSTGGFYFGSPQPLIHLTVSGFAHRDTSLAVTLNPYAADSMDIWMQPEIESTIEGYVTDGEGNGIAAELDFYAHGYPLPGPYLTISSDSNGYYHLQTVIGDYDIEVTPQAPYLGKRLENINLTIAPLTLNIELIKADLLLVDDDRGESYETYYIEAVEALARTYYLWEVQSDGVPPSAVRNAFPDSVMIWFTGDSSRSPLTLEEQNVLIDYLNSGRKLFLTGQDIAEHSTGSGLPDSLGIGFLGNTTIAQVRGDAGSAISRDLIFLIDGPGGADNQKSQDILTITNSSRATPVFNYGSAAVRPAGVQYQHSGNGGKAVFLGFGFEAITDEAVRDTLMRRVLEYLLDRSIPVSLAEGRLPSIPGQPDLCINYPNPFNSTTVISWQLAVGSPIRLSIYDLTGREVAVLVDEEQRAGRHQVKFDAADLASGIYLYRLKAGNFIQSRKMLVIR